MCEGSGLNVASRRRPCRESDRVVRALRPGNAGGAKGPDFRCASEDGEVEVIGDKPGNTVEDRSRPRLLCRGRRRVIRCAITARSWITPRVPLDEAGRKAGCRKSARPV